MKWVFQCFYPARAKSTRGFGQLRFAFDYTIKYHHTKMIYLKQNDSILEEFISFFLNVQIIVDDIYARNKRSNNTASSG